MIYGNRIFAFNEEAKEDSVETSNSTITYESLVNGYDAVVALAEVTENDGLLISYNSLLEETILNEAKDARRTSIVKESKKAIKALLTENGFLKCQVGGFYIGGECAKFMKGEGNTYLYAIKLEKKEVTTGSSYSWGSGSTTTASSTKTTDLTDEVVKWITNNKNKVISAIKEATKVQKVSVTSVKIQEGRMGVINLAVEYKI